MYKPLNDFPHFKHMNKKINGDNNTLILTKIKQNGNIQPKFNEESETLIHYGSQVVTCSVFIL